MSKQLIAFLLIPLLSFTVSDWVTVKLDDHVQIDFPASPETKNIGGNSVWVRDIDSNSRCMAMIVDFAQFGMDSAALKAEMDKDETFDQFKQGVMAQIPGSSLVSEKKTQTNGYTTFEYVIDMGKKDANDLGLMYNKNVFVGSRLYSMNFYEKKGKPQDANRNKFFNSFRTH